jgi:hypothetical protein
MVIKVEIVAEWIKSGSTDIENKNARAERQAGRLVI